MPRDKSLDLWKATEVTVELPGGSWDHRGNMDTARDITKAE